MLPKVSIKFVKWVVLIGLIVMLITDIYKHKYNDAITRFCFIAFLVYLDITVKVEIKK
jgi:hypothetical protein